MTWIEQHPKLCFLIGVASAALVAFSVGRFTAPLKVETKTVDRVVYQDRVVEKLVEVKGETKTETKIVYRDRVITKDGTITEHEIEKTSDRDAEKDVVTDAKHEEVASASEHITEKTVTLRPNWRVGVLVGASIQKPFVPIAGPLVIGAEVDYRIAGGLSAGVWLNTSGAAGLGLNLEF